MTPTDPSAQSDDLFSSLLQSLAQPDPAEQAASGDARAGGASGVTAEAVDRELFPSLLIDLSDDAPPVPDDLAEMTAIDELSRWGPDAAAPPPVDPVVIAELFPDDDDEAARLSPPVAMGTFEPHVPWWEDRRIQAAIGVGAVLLLIAGGLFLAMRDTSSGSTEDLTTDTLPEIASRNEDAAITTSTAVAGPTPSGLPVPLDDTTATTAKSTPTTKKPTTTLPSSKPPSGGGTSGGGSPAPTTVPETTPSTEAPPTTEAPPVDADVQWGRAMAARTSIFPGWQGIWQIGDGSPSNAFLSAVFDEPARRLTVTIDVEGADQYDLRFDVSVVPGVPTTTAGTNFGTVTATLDAERNLTIDGTQIPGTSVNRSRIAGPFTTSKVRLSVTGDSDGFDPIDFAVYDFI